MVRQPCLLARISILAPELGSAYHKPPSLDPPKCSFFLLEPSFASAKRQFPPAGRTISDFHKHLSRPDRCSACFLLFHRPSAKGGPPRADVTCAIGRAFVGLRHSREVTRVGSPKVAHYFSQIQGSGRGFQYWPDRLLPVGKARRHAHRDSDNHLARWRAFGADDNDGPTNPA